MSQLKNSGAPRKYTAFHTSSFGQDSVVKLCGDLRCIRGTKLFTPHRSDKTLLSNCVVIFVVFGEHPLAGLDGWSNLCKGDGQVEARVGFNRLRAFHGTRPHTVGYIGGCDQEQGETSVRVMVSSRRELEPSIAQSPDFGHDLFREVWGVGLRV